MDEKEGEFQPLDRPIHGCLQLSIEHEVGNGRANGEISTRKTTKQDVKTTKTGKILHRPRRIGVNKRNTAYNRFLQQRSKDLAKHQSHLTPQQVSPCCISVPHPPSSTTKISSLRLQLMAECGFLSLLLVLSTFAVYI
jgi:hypothetical protein